MVKIKKGFITYFFEGVVVLAAMGTRIGLG